MIEGIFEFLFRMVFEFFFFWTGELVLFLVTLGRRRPGWNVHADKSGAKSAVFLELSFYVGILAWLAIGVAVSKLT